MVPGEAELLAKFAQLVRQHAHLLALEIAPEDFGPFEEPLRRIGDANLVFTFSALRPDSIATHATGAYRRLLEHLRAAGFQSSPLDPQHNRDRGAG